MLGRGGGGSCRREKEREERGVLLLSHTFIPGSRAILRSAKKVFHFRDWEGTRKRKGSNVIRRGCARESIFSLHVSVYCEKLF